MKNDLNIYSFRVIIEPEKPKGYHGFVPLLCGLHTFGATIDEVKKILKRRLFVIFKDY